MSLSSDGDGALEWIGHDEGYDCSPAGKLGFLPRCLCSLLVMDRLTQYLTEIKGPGWSLMLSQTMYAGDVRVPVVRRRRHVPQEGFRSL